VTDPEGTIREANCAAATLLGVRQEFLVGNPLLLFVSKEAHESGLGVRHYETYETERGVPTEPADLAGIR
jgi:hypothetical protein